jgi:hypothetical protein
MMLERSITIRSDKFPVLPGEEEEIYNDGMFGKALALYLKENFEQRGYIVPSYGAEDWGWYIEIECFEVVLEYCIYCYALGEGLNEYCISEGPVKSKVWLWSKFKYVETKPHKDILFDDLLSIIVADKDIQLINEK